MIFKGRRVIAAAAAVLFAGTVLQPVPSFAQNDTIIIRSSRIDIGKGVINPQGDTVIIGNEPVETVLLPVFDDSLALLPENAPSAQYIKVPWSELAARADSLRRAYRFSDAMALYRRAADAATSPADKLSCEDRLVQARNGRNMMDFCSFPKVVARQRFSLQDFYLFYPLKGGSWRKTPNPFDDSVGEGLVQATYVPKGARTVYFSAKDDSEIRNIYVSTDEDTLWSAPRLVGESLLSAGDEIYPMLSPDGKTMYFASNGLYGMGGFDLYSSAYDEASGEWGEPVNLGFPYSSPKDDFLLVDTDDGKYTIFASNRDCARDSVYIYVLEHESVPVRKAVTDLAGLRTLSALMPENAPKRMDNASAVSESMPDTDGTRRYMDEMARVRRLRDSIYVCEKELDALRLSLGKLQDAERQAAAAAVIAKEKSLGPLKEALAAAGKKVQDLERQFLSGGIVPDASRVRQSADREVVGASSGYTFTKNPPGQKLKVNVAPRTPAFDYSFKIMPVGRFAPNPTLPSGIVYQISLFTSSSHASLDDIQGLTPVFERLTSSLRYSYSAGVFRKYSDALENLNKVRRLGFRSAAVIAWRNGKPVDLRTARREE